MAAAVELKFKLPPSFGGGNAALEFAPPAQGADVVSVRFTSAFISGNTTVKKLDLQKFIHSLGSVLNG